MKFDQKPNGSRFTKNPLGAEIPYTLTGIFDRASAKAIAVQLLPNAVLLTEGMVYLKDAQLTERGHAIHDVVAVYGQGDDKSNGSLRFSFSISGKTVHVDGTDPDKVTKYPPTAPDHKGLINVDTSGGELTVGGADIVVAQSKRRISVKFPAGVITEAYATLLENLVGCSNSVRFLGRDPGELIFLGSEGAQGTDVETTIDFEFGIEKNLTGLKFGTVTNVEKKGQDLIWVQSQNYTDANGKPARKPVAVYVHQIGERVNFGAILGFGA